MDYASAGVGYFRRHLFVRCSHNARRPRRARLDGLLKATKSVFLFRTSHVPCDRSCSDRQAHRSNDMPQRPIQQMLRRKLPTSTSIKTEVKGESFERPTVPPTGSTTSLPRRRQRYPCLLGPDRAAIEAYRSSTALWASTLQVSLFEARELHRARTQALCTMGVILASRLFDAKDRREKENSEVKSLASRIHSLSNSHHHLFLSPPPTTSPPLHPPPPTSPPYDSHSPTAPPAAHSPPTPPTASGPPG